MNPRNAMVVLSCFVMMIVMIGGCHEADAASAPEPQPDAEAAALLAEVNEHFTAEGKPIHPKLIYEFEGWMSDGGPVTLKLDLSNGVNANDEYYEPLVKTGENPDSADGWWAQWTEDGEGPRESFYYYRVGRLVDGTHVLRTSYSGGGRGRFGGVSFVTAKVEPVGDTGRWRVILETRGNSGIGDRAGRQISVEENHVVVGPSHSGVPEPHRTEGTGILRPSW